MLKFRRRIKMVDKKSVRELFKANEASSIEMEEAFVRGFSTAYQLLIDSLI